MYMEDTDVAKVDRRQGWRRLMHARAMGEVDHANATTIGGTVGLVIAASQIVALALHPPVDGVGPFGWVLAGLVVGIAAVVSWGLIDRARALTSNQLLGLAGVGIVQVTVLASLTGGQPEREVMLFWIVFAAAAQVPARAAAVLAGALLLSLVLVYGGGPDSRALTQLAFDVPLWTGLALLAHMLFGRLRQQRLELREERAGLAELARSDELTGLGNRRALEEALEREEGRVSRGSGVCSIAIVDLDGFKEVNDRFGHLAGDELLRAVADVLRAGLRRPDQSFRWGGDEFALLMPDSDHDAAEQAVARLRRAICETCLGPTGEPVATGWGIAQVTQEVSAREAMARADGLLIAAKQRGRETPGGVLHSS